MILFDKGGRIMTDLLAKNLKNLRLAHKLTQDELAAIIKKDRSLVAKYETGKAIPPLPVLKILSSLYNTSVDELCAEKNNANLTVLNDPEKEIDSIKYAELTKEEQMLILKLRLLGYDKFLKFSKKVDIELNKTQI